MRSLMPREFMPTIWQLDATPDGFAEVVIEIGGRIVATSVVGPGVDGPAVCRSLIAEFKRKC